MAEYSQVVDEVEFYTLCFDRMLVLPPVKCKLHRIRAQLNRLITGTFVVRKDFIVIAFSSAGQSYFWFHRLSIKSSRAISSL